MVMNHGNPHTGIMLEFVLLAGCGSPFATWFTAGLNALAYVPNGKNRACCAPRGLMMLAVATVGRLTCSFPHSLATHLH